MSVLSSTVQNLASIPELSWELSFGIYLIAKGFKQAPVTVETMDAR